MHQLHLALNEDEGLRAAVTSLSEQVQGNPLKHAIVLDLNPFWLRAYRLNEAGLNVDLAWVGTNFAYLNMFVGRSGGPVDLTRRFSEADALSKYVFGERIRPSPYLLRILARAIQDPKE